MPSNIESRIVSLVFDNQQFEKKVAESQKTLTKLDEKIKFKDADKSFDSLTKAASKVSFSKLTTSIGTIGTQIDKAMSLGNIALERFRNRVVDIGEKLISQLAKPITSAFNQIVEGGFNRATNIDKAKFKMSGLGVAWDEIYDDINYGVSDTAYGLDQAAAAAANLVSVGVKFGSTFGDTGSSPMAKALRGISGLASMFDRSYEDIAGLYQVIGAAGHVTNDALSRFTERGIPIAAKLQDVFKVTSDELQDMCKEGEISIDEFIQIMDEAFGEHAKDSNKTFEGAFSNMNAALSRTGEKFAESYRANMTDVYNSIRLLINAFNKKLTPIIEVADAIMTRVAEKFTTVVDKATDWVKHSGVLEIIFEGVADLVDGIYEVLVTISEVFQTVFKPIEKTVEEINERFGTIKVNVDDGMEETGLKKKARSFADMAKSFLEFVKSEKFIDSVYKVVTGIHDFVKIISGIVKAIVGLVRNFIDLLNKGNAERGLDKLIDPLSLIKKLFDLVMVGLINFYKFLKGDKVAAFTVFLADMWFKVVDLVKATRDFLKSEKVVAFFDKVKSTAITAWETIKSAKDVLLGFVETVKTSFNNVFHGNFLDTITRAFKDFISRAFPSLSDIFAKEDLEPGEEKASMIAKIIEGIFNAIRSGMVIFSVVGDFIGIMIRNLARLFDAGKEAFSEVFGDQKDKKSATSGFKDIVIAIWSFIKSLELSDAAIENFKKIFKGVFTVFALVKDIVVAVYSAVSSIFHTAVSDTSKGTGSIIDSITAAIAVVAGWVIAIKEWLDANDVINKVVTIVVKAFTVIWKVATAVFSIIKDVYNALDNLSKRITGSSLKENFESLIDTVLKLGDIVLGLFKGIADDGSIDDAEEKVSPFVGLWATLQTVFEKFFDFLGGAWPSIEKILDALLSGLGVVLDLAGELLKNLNIPDLASAGLGVSALFGAWDGTVGMMSGLVDNVNGFLSGIKDTIELFQKSKYADTLKTIATAVLMLAASMVAMALIDPKSLAISFMALEGIMEILKKAGEWMANIMEKFDKKSIKAIASFSKAIKALAISVLILAVSAVMLSTLSWPEITKGLVSVAGLTLILVGATWLISKFVKDVPKVALALIGMAIAIRMLVKPMKELSQLGWEDLARGLISIFFLLGEMFIFVFALDGVNAKKAATSMIAMAIAIRLLVKPMEAFAAMEWDAIKNGLFAVGALMLIVIAAAYSLSGEKIFGASVAMIAMALAIRLLVAPMKEFSQLSVNGIIKGLLAITVILGEMVLFGVLLDKVNPMKSVLLILAFALAVNALRKPLKDFSKFSTKEFLTGMLAITLILGELALFSVLLDKINPAKAVLSILAFALAIKVITKPIVELAKLNIEQVLTGLVAIAGALGILVIAGMAAANPLISGGLIVVTAALLGLGAAALMVGAGLYLLAQGMVLLAQISQESGDGIKLGLSVCLEFILDSIKVVGQAIKNSVKDTANTIVSLVIYTIIGILGALVDTAPMIIETVVMLCIQVLTGLADSITRHAKEIKEAVLGLIASVLKLVLEFFGIDTSCMDSRVFKDIGFALLSGLIFGVWGLIPALIEVIISWWPEISKWFTEKWESFKSWGSEVWSKLKAGIEEGDFNLIWEALKLIWDGIVGFFEGIWKGLKNIGKWIVETITGGMSGEEASELAEEAASDLGNTLTNSLEESVDESATTKEIGKKGSKAGETFVEAAETSIKEGKHRLKRAASDAGDSMSEGVDESIESGNFLDKGKGILSTLGMGMSDEKETEQLVKRGKSVGEITTESVSQGMSSLPSIFGSYGDSGNMELLTKLFNTNNKEDAYNHGALLAQSEAEGYATFEAVNPDGTPYVRKDTAVVEFEVLNPDGTPYKPEEQGESDGEDYVSGMKSALDQFNLNDYLNKNGAEVDVSLVSDGMDYESYLQNLGLDGTYTSTGSYTTSTTMALDDTTSETLSAILENQNNDTTSEEVMSLREEVTELKKSLFDILGGNVNTVVGELGNKISRLEQAIYSMDIVVDTGALVGQIAPKMDSTLGKYAGYKGRGN